MRFGISLLRTRPEMSPHVVHAAEELGFESVWISDHLVLPTALDLEAGLEQLEADFGDVETSLRGGLGLDDDQLQRLRGHLLG